jgi:hypothetical protein
MTKMAIKQKEQLEPTPGSSHGPRELLVLCKEFEGVHRVKGKASYKDYGYGREHFGSGLTLT